MTGGGAGGSERPEPYERTTVTEQADDAARLCGCPRVAKAAIATQIGTHLVPEPGGPGQRPSYPVGETARNAGGLKCG
jgi:hypothetical protein